MYERLAANDGNHEAAQSLDRSIEDEKKIRSPVLPNQKIENYVDEGIVGGEGRNDEEQEICHRARQEQQQEQEQEQEQEQQE